MSESCEFTPYSVKLLADIEKFNKKKEFDQITATATKNVNSRIYVTLDPIKIKIACSIDPSEFIFVEEAGQGIVYSWLDDINVWILDEKPAFIKILKKISKTYLKKKTKEIKPEIKSDHDELMFVDNFDTDTFVSNTDITAELELKTNRKVLEKLIPTSRSQITLDSDNKSNIAKALFKDNTVANIVIDKYLELGFLYTNNKKNHIELTLVDNNIYHWNLKCKNFSNESLNKNLSELNKVWNYNFIEIDIHIHDKLYPNYPPQVRILRPRLNNALMHRISVMKLLQFVYWSPCRTLDTIIDKIYDVLDKNAVIDIDSHLNDKIKYPHGAYLDLEDMLLKLSSFINVETTKYDDLEKDESYTISVPTLDKKKIDVVNHTPKQYGKINANIKGNGTGYGCNTSWDMTSYLKTQEERDHQVQKILRQIITTIQKHPQNDLKTIYNIVDYSYLMPFVKSQLNGVTLMDITKHSAVFKLLFELLQNFANEDAIHVFGPTDNKENTKSIYDILNELNTIVVATSKIGSASDADTNDELTIMLTILFDMVKEPYQKYIADKTKKLILEPVKLLDQDKDKDKNQVVDLKKIYTTAMDKYKFLSDKISGDGTNYKYNADLKTAGVIKFQKRVKAEYATLIQSVPIHYDASIFVCADSSNLSAMRVLITGPPDTPYENGCYIFDLHLPNTFPNSPPKALFVNTGGKRINPNLYETGYVCLSLLGTWRGTSPSETWNIATSNLLQLFISIQSQILVDQPFKNEPGYETSTDKYSIDEYDQHVRLDVMTNSMLDLLVNKDQYPQFKEVINAHFYHKKDAVLKTCQKWAGLATNAYKEQCKKVLKSIETELNKLKI